MVCPTKCTWGCRTCLCLLWRFFSTIGLPREPSLETLLKKWSHCWRRRQGCLGGTKQLQANNLVKHKVKDFGLDIGEPLADCYQRSDRNRTELRCERKIDQEQSALRDEKANPALCGVPFVRRYWARVSAFLEDITVFVSRRSDVEAVKKAVAKYEQIAGDKINFDKSESLWLGAWRGGLDLSALATVPSASFGCSSGPASKWSVIGWRYRQM